MWRYEKNRKGERTKVPINPATGRKAKSNTPATWSTFDDAVAACERFDCSGVAFVFSEADDFFGIDLDACRNPDTGELTPWAAEIVGAVDSYAKYRQAAYGVKIVARGKMPDGSRNVKKLSNVPTFGTKEPEIAVYDRVRFWTMTGQRLPGAQLCCEPRQEALEALLAKLFPPTAAANGKHKSNGDTAGTWFDRLLSDCATAENGQRSEKDFALCAQAVRHGFTGDEIWARAGHVGKFAESGRDYFDRTWQRATEAAANDPPKRQRKPKPIIIGEPASLDLRESSARTDIANARRFVAKHGRDVRHCDQWGKWFVWNGKAWPVDHERRVEMLAKQVADEIWHDTGKLLPDVDRATADELVRFAKATASSWGIGAMLSLARSEAGIPITPDKLDCDPWALNVQNGTIDLRTAELREHRREDLLTKIAPVTFDAGANCPTWRKALSDIFAGNESLMRYVQRLAGYSLTGIVRDHVLPFLYGIGANGKSTLLNTLLALLGTDYAMKAAPDLLLTKRGESHPTERADLFGKRLVAAIETEDGKRLAESLVKELSGGDRVRARRMREDFWEFSPTHKIWLAANHKPTIRGQDFGIWRRVKLIPFNVRFEGKAADTALPEKLLAELPGILNWALLGCLEWQADGLDEPGEVQAATGGYRAAMDVLGQFVGDCCELGGDCESKASDVRTAYETWCKANGERPVNGRRFGDYLTDRGVERRKSHGTIVYSGVAIQ